MSAFSSLTVSLYLITLLAVSGSLYGVACSPSLGPLLREVSAEITIGGDGTLYDEMVKASIQPSHKNNLVEERKQEILVGALGSGSDFTVFLQHLGISSSSIAFFNGPNDPAYHYHSVRFSVRKYVTA
jgi:N-acetylated-alpha-linked acidic dipeptidase